MLVKIKQKIRCGIGAEEGNSSVSSSYVLDRKIFTNIDSLAIEGSIESRENMRKNIEKILDIWYDEI